MKKIIQKIGFAVIALLGTQTVFACGNDSTTINKQTTGTSVEVKQNSDASRATMGQMSEPANTIKINQSK